MERNYLGPDKYQRKMIEGSDMSQVEAFDILGSGAGGKLLAWHMGHAGKKVAVVERQRKDAQRQGIKVRFHNSITIC